MVPQNRGLAYTLRRGMINHFDAWRAARDMPVIKELAEKGCEAICSMRSCAFGETHDCDKETAAFTDTTVSQSRVCGINCSNLD